MSSLCVSLDQVGALRAIRKKSDPDPAHLAVLIELAGADAISVQYRRDRRHIRERDLYVLRELIKNNFIIETSPHEEQIDRILEIKPTMVTFTADQTDFDSPMNPIDFATTPIDFSSMITQLHGSNILASVLIEPDVVSVKGALKSGFDAIMIDCNYYTGADNINDAQTELDRIDSAAQYAVKQNLTVRAGGSLNINNITPLKELNLIDEFVIGHSLISKSMLVGVQQAVNEMKQALSSNPVME